MFLPGRSSRLPQKVQPSKRAQRTRSKIDDEEEGSAVLLMAHDISLLAHEMMRERVC
jgi:hypothetical protein